MTPRANRTTVHPLYWRLQDEFNYPALTLDSLDAFAAEPGDAVLFFSDEPIRRTTRSTRR